MTAALPSATCGPGAPKLVSRKRQAVTAVSRRALCKACAEALGLQMQDVAARCHVTYYHLILVLDGKRQGSARLEATLREIMLAAKPLLLDSLSQLE